MRGRKTVTRSLALAALIWASLSCSDTAGPVCTDEGARFEISPAQLDIIAGRATRVTVTAVTCSGHVREEVYPTMTTADPSVAIFSNTYRTITGQAAGTTVLAVSDAEVLSDVHAGVTVH